MPKTIREQFRNNFVAIVSLIVAITSLSYITWRNERSEFNRNIRQAGFEILLKLGELQEVVFFGHYDPDSQRGNPRTGWADILVISDLGQSMPAPVPGSADGLLASWDANWQGLGQNDDSLAEISAAIDTLRADVREALNTLD